MTARKVRYRQVWSLVLCAMAAALVIGLLTGIVFALSAAVAGPVQGSVYVLNADLQAATCEVASAADAFLPLVPKSFELAFEYEVRGCLPETAMADDRLDIYVEDGDIVVDHHQVTYNCCAQIDVRLIDARPLFQIVECETFSEAGPCRCVCPYDVHARISDLPSGRYRVEVLNCDHSRVYGWDEVTVP